LLGHTKTNESEPAATLKTVRKQNRSDTVVARGIDLTTYTARDIDRAAKGVLAAGLQVQRVGINHQGSIFVEIKQSLIKSQLYVLVAGDATWPVKIGFTTKPVSARVKALQTGCPYELRLICSAPATRLEEQAVHNAFAPYRVKGEWFGSAPHLTRFIRAISGGTPISEALSRIRQTISKSAHANDD
jgi:hypothetical protein